MGLLAAQRHAEVQRTQLEGYPEVPSYWIFHLL
jgi:hypothetical protein